MAEARPIGEEICIRCGNPMTVRGVCHRCRHDPPDPIRGIRGVYFYNGPIAQGIRSLKYRGLKPLASILAAPLADYISAHPVLFDALVPVPLHPDRVAERGFNQSELLAESIRLTLNIPTRTDLVQRVVATRPQAQLNRHQRLQNVANAFAPAPDATLHGETLLLIDDVSTTGATLRACANILKRIGAGDIWALTVARADISMDASTDGERLSAADAFLIWDAERKPTRYDPADPFI